MISESVLDKFPPLIKGGILRLQPHINNLYDISKPFLAMTESPGLISSNMPLHIVISLSEIPPVYKLDTKIYAPIELTSIKPLKVL